MSDGNENCKVVAAGVEFSWFMLWCSYADVNHDPFGNLYGYLRWRQLQRRAGTKEPRRTRSKKIRKRDLLFVLWSIYQEQERAIPETVWDARQALERKIMALPESALYRGRVQ